MGKFNIDLDLTEVVEEFTLSKDEAKEMATEVVNAVSRAIYREWAAAARKELSSTRQGYIRGLQMISNDNLTNAIVLRGAFNNMLEDGVSSYDMKIGFSKSPKVKFNKKGGWYLTIPFRMSVPGSLGENAAFSGSLPEEVYQAIQKLDKGGLSKSDIPSKYRLGSMSKWDPSAVKNKTSGYKHKHSIFEGVQKFTGEYENTKQNQYGSFRRVGANSNPGAFIHAGLKQGKFADKALQNVDTDIIVDNAVDNFLAR